jgi:hypothetical protein
VSEKPTGARPASPHRVPARAVPHRRADRRRGRRLIIDQAGFTVHYVVLAAICLLELLPLARMTQTVEVSR